MYICMSIHNIDIVGSNVYSMSKQRTPFDSICISTIQKNHVQIVKPQAFCRYTSRECKLLGSLWEWTVQVFQQQWSSCAFPKCVKTILAVLVEPKFAPLTGWLGWGIYILNQLLGTAPSIFDQMGEYRCVFILDFKVMTKPLQIYPNPFKHVSV